MMLFDYPLNVANVVTVEAAASLQTDWIKPKLGDSVFAFHVNVRRFLPVARKEEETIGTHSEDRRHMV
jgi:hypothetical protein